MTADEINDRHADATFWVSETVTGSDAGEQWITWCSFADDAGCLGILILEGALDHAAASLLALATGQNPGGELMAAPLPVRGFPMSEQAAVLENVGRIISIEEARRIFEGQTIGEWEKEQEN